MIHIAPNRQNFEPLLQIVLWAINWVSITEIIPKPSNSLEVSIYLDLQLASQLAESVLVREGLVQSIDNNSGVLKDEFV